MLYRSRKTESTSREVILYEMQKKWVSENKFQCIQRMYDEIQFCINVGYEEVIEPMIPETGVRQGSNLVPYLFNIFIVDIIDYTSEENVHTPVLGV